MRLGLVFGDVRRIVFADFLFIPIAIRKNDNVIVCNVATGPPIPPAMNYARAAEHSVSVPISVISKANIMNGANHLRFPDLA